MVATGGTLMARRRFCGSYSGWCPICGEISKPGSGPHRCDVRVLAAIDGAYRRDIDEEEPRDYHSFGSRLADGFMMLDDEREGYGEPGLWSFPDP